jgi:transposase
VAEPAPQAQRQSIEAAAMDMSAGFAADTAQEAPQVVIVHDKFHVTKMLNEAVDRVRRTEHKELLKRNDQRLTGSRQLWLYNPINLKDDVLKSSKPDSKRAKNLTGMDVERELRRLLATERSMACSRLLL